MATMSPAAVRRLMAYQTFRSAGRYTEVVEIDGYQIPCWLYGFVMQILGSPQDLNQDFTFIIPQLLTHGLSVDYRVLMVLGREYLEADPMLQEAWAHTDSQLPDPIPVAYRAYDPQPRVGTLDRPRTSRIPTRLTGDDSDDGDQNLSQDSGRSASPRRGNISLPVRQPSQTRTERVLGSVRSSLNNFASSMRRRNPDRGVNGTTGRTGDNRPQTSGAITDNHHDLTFRPNTSHGFGPAQDAPFPINDPFAGFQAVGQQGWFDTALINPDLLDGNEFVDWELAEATGLVTLSDDDEVWQHVPPPLSPQPERTATPEEDHPMFIEEQDPFEHQKTSESTQYTSGTTPSHPPSTPSPSPPPALPRSQLLQPDNPQAPVVAAPAAPAQAPIINQAAQPLNPLFGTPRPQGVTTYRGPNNPAQALIKGGFTLAMTGPPDLRAAAWLAANWTPGQHIPGAVAGRVFLCKYPGCNGYSRMKRDIRRHYFRLHGLDENAAAAIGAWSTFPVPADNDGVPLQPPNQNGTNNGTQQQQQQQQQ